MDDGSLQLAAAAGISIRVIPFINTIIREDAALRNSLSALPEQLTAVFTSWNGVAGVRRNSAAVPQWNIACIEGKTRRAAEDFFGKKAIMITAPDATKLAAALVRSKIEEVVFFCGNHRLDHLPQALKQAGVKVRELIVYTTEETPAAVAESYKAVLFFSPSAVNSFFSANTLPSDCTTFAIGHTTAKAITQHTSNKVIVSPESDERTMMQTLINYYNEERLIT